MTLTVNDQRDRKSKRKYLFEIVSIYINEQEMLETYLTLNVEL